MNNVAPLLQLVVKFVVENFENVESLQGLPELMGESLFQALVIHGQTSNINIGRHLKVFAEAYGDMLLKSLDLNNQLVILNEHLENLQPSFFFMTALDLSHCHLGSKHDVIDCIAQMMQLETLHLNDCAVDDEAIRKITIPCRMLCRGILNLKELDISNNPKLTSKCLPLLYCLKQLHHLRLPVGTELDVTKKIVLSQLSKLGFCEENPTIFPLSKVATEGWALPIIEKWTMTPAVVFKKKSLKTQSFYSNSKRQLNFLIPKEHVKASQFICLVRKNQQHVSKTNFVVPRKKLKADDEDIMNQYRKSTVNQNVTSRSSKMTGTFLDHL